MAAQSEVNNQWVNKQYEMQGDWQITEEAGKTVFKLGDNFKTLPGPDLKVYLIKPNLHQVNNRDSIDQGGVYLGELISPSGAQTYDIPADIDLSDYQSIAVHCKRFSVVWGGVVLAK